MNDGAFPHDSEASGNDGPKGNGMSSNEDEDDDDQDGDGRPRRRRIYATGG